MTQAAAGALAAGQAESAILPATGSPLRDGVLLWGGAAIAALHLWLNTFGRMSELRMAVLHFACFAVLAAAAFPALRQRRRASLAIDGLTALLAVSLPAYLWTVEDALFDRGGVFLWTDWIFTGLAVLLALDLTRRATGWTIPILSIVAILYVVWFGRMMPGVFSFPGLPMDVVLFRVFFSDDGMFGSIARISYSFVFMFILFGAFLTRSGAGAFIVDFARAVAGRVAGGPGLVAVIASGLTGTISGSAVANVASTGVITIPMMKRAGFKPAFAAGVETAASNGGGLMPPVMGAGVFIMASYTQISYLTICAVAAIPALLYFASVAFHVRIQARKNGLQGETGTLPGVGAVLARGGLAFFGPILMLMGMLVAGYTPVFAGGAAIVATVLASWTTRAPMGPRAILEALSLGARTMVLTAMLLITIGIAVNTIVTTGLGNTVSLMLVQWSGQSLLLLLVLVAVASLVVGTALPVSASYVIVATLAAPAMTTLMLQNQLVAALADGTVPDMVRSLAMLVAPDLAGSLDALSPDQARALVAALPQDMVGMAVDATLAPEAAMVALLAAHLIVFWLSQDSNVTPPVCIPAFAAAAIAGAGTMASGFQAWRAAKALYVLPVMFAFTPLISLDLAVQARVAVFALFGLWALAAAMSGHLERPLSPLWRLAHAALGVAMVWPLPLGVHLAALAAFAACLLREILAERRTAPQPALR